MSQVYGYSKGWVHKPLATQASILASNPRLRGIDVSHAEELAKVYTLNGRLVLPQGADGLALFSKHSALARYLEGFDDWPVYNRALKYSLDTMKFERSNFIDLTAGRIGPEHERLTSRTASVLEELENLPGDLIVRAVQTGILYRNESVRDVRNNFTEIEFGLDSVSVASFLITHPERLLKSEDLAIDCAGSERAPEADGQFVSAPCFCFRGDELEFGGSALDDANPDYGSASAFLPAPAVEIQISAP